MKKKEAEKQAKLKSEQEWQTKVKEIEEEALSQAATEAQAGVRAKQAEAPVTLGKE